jgi:hypothetical protein
MLKTCYKEDGKYPLRSARAANVDQYSVGLVLWHLSVYKVADKYEAPKILNAATCNVVYLLEYGLNNFSKVEPCTPEIISKVGLREILGAVYELTGHRTMNDTLRKYVLNVLLLHPSTTYFNVIKLHRFAEEMREIAKDLPDFGRDMFLMITKPSPETQPPKFLGIMKEVTCPQATCNKKQWVFTRIVKSHCMACGVSSDWEAAPAQ